MRKRSTKIANRDPVSAVAVMFCLFVLVLGASLWSPAPQANTCVAPPPLRISGALCGRVADPTGGAVPDIELRVEDEKGSVIGQAHSNASGDFKFPPLPRGSYRLTTTAPGFMEYIGQIEILTSNQMSCRRATSVELALTSCQGGIDKQRPPHFREPGW